MAGLCRRGPTCRLLVFCAQITQNIVQRTITVQTGWAHNSHAGIPLAKRGLPPTIVKDATDKLQEEPRIKCK